MFLCRNRRLTDSRSWPFSKANVAHVCRSTEGTNRVVNVRAGVGPLFGFTGSGPHVPRSPLPPSALASNRVHARPKLLPSGDPKSVVNTKSLSCHSGPSRRRCSACCFFHRRSSAIVVAEIGTVPFDAFVVGSVVIHPCPPSFSFFTPMRVRVFPTFTVRCSTSTC